MIRFWLVFLGAAIVLPAAVTIERYHSHDFNFGAPVSGNPFDVEISGEFTGPDGVRLSVPGFYDGGGCGRSASRPHASDAGLCTRSHELRRSTAKRKPKSNVRRTAI